MSNKTYYNKSKDMILNTAKDYFESDEKRNSLSKHEINTEICLKKTKIKRETVEETKTILCLKKRNKD